MSDVFYLRSIEPPAKAADVYSMAEQAGGCFNLHRVEWQHSFLASDGSKMLCWYRAPDAESARLALRQLGSDMNAIWSGNTTASADTAPAMGKVSLLAELSFEQGPAQSELDSALENLAQSGEETGYLGCINSADGRQLICLFNTQDEAAALASLAAAGLPPATMWACETLTPSAIG